jgi:hypothetical protein
MRELLHEELPDLLETQEGQEFSEAFRDEYDEPNPNLYAIYGYEAMQLALDSIACVKSVEVVQHGPAQSPGSKASRPPGAPRLVG